MHSHTDYYQAAIAEVRSHQSPGSLTDEQVKQIKMLEDNPLLWEQALQEAVDELDSQLDIKREELDDVTAYAVNTTEVADAVAEFEAWRKKNRTFKKYIVRRLRYVQRLNGSNPSEDVEASKLEEIGRLLVEAAREEKVGDEDASDAKLSEAWSLAETLI